MVHNVLGSGPLQPGVLPSGYEVKEQVVLIDFCVLVSSML